MVKVNVSISVVSWGEFVKSVLYNLFRVYGNLIFISGATCEKQRWRSPQADEMTQFISRILNNVTALLINIGDDFQTCQNLIVAWMTYITI